MSCWQQWNLSSRIDCQAATEALKPWKLSEYLQWLVEWKNWELYTFSVRQGTDVGSYLCLEMSCVELIYRHRGLVGCQEVSVFARMFDSEDQYWR